MTPSLSPVARPAIAALLADPLFELIPLANALDRARHLPSGARISVTASPNQTLDDSLDLASALVERGFRVTPHLSARMTRDRGHLARLLGRVADLGISTAFVVGGDGEVTGVFPDGLSLLEAMADVGHDLEIGVPCYPEGHPLISDPSLQASLTAKQAHAAWMTSQMCFDASALEAWASSARADGIRLPLVLGLPGVADRLKLVRIAARIGVGGSLSFLRKNTGLVSRFVAPGGYDPAELLVGLGDALADPALAIAGCHIYTFNQTEATEAWRRRYLDSLA